ncbi:MAG: hypothetical protein R2690_06070 [Acidimicrobiales bacterium]
MTLPLTVTPHHCWPMSPKPPSLNWLPSMTPLFVAKSPSSM